MLAYGTLSLLVNRLGAHDAVRKNFCWAIPCSAERPDSLSNLAPASIHSLPDAKAALLREPASAYRWTDMADAQLNANNVDGAKYALTRALAAGPGSPSVLFRAARFYLRLEDIPETLAKLTAILRNPDLSEYYSQVFSIYRQMDLPLDEILAKGIPHNEAAATGFLSFWIQEDQADEAAETWTWLKENSLVDLDAAADYVSFMAKNTMYENAVQIWADYNSKTQPDFLKTNWIFNGSFERDPADCPFDWSISSNSDVAASIENGVNYGGSSALRLAFSGQRNDQFRAIYEDVILNPGPWTLRGFMRTSHIKGEQGLFFHIVDAEDSSRLDASTSGFEGTEEWSAQEKKFVVPAGTRIVRIELICPKSQSPAVETAANVWVDHVEIIPTR